MPIAQTILTSAFHAPRRPRQRPQGRRWVSSPRSRFSSHSSETGGAVFGFALTLLVVSLDVPKTFADLITMMRGFPAFALCFLFLALIWNGHDKYCRRYGLDDGTARFLTCVMLFLVLFYVYPLKFLFNFSITGLLFDSSRPARLQQPSTIFNLS